MTPCVWCLMALKTDSCSCSCTLHLNTSTLQRQTLQRGTRTTEARITQRGEYRQFDKIWQDLTRRNIKIQLNLTAAANDLRCMVRISYAAEERNRSTSRVHASHKSKNTPCKRCLVAGTTQFEILQPYGTIGQARYLSFLSGRFFSNDCSPKEKGLQWSLCIHHYFCFPFCSHPELSHLK
jgi:hypothetical protein